MSDDVTVHHGDALEVLATMPDGSVDAVVTDPPYGLEFMGKDWDRPWAVSANNAVGYAGRDDLHLPAHRDSRNANCRTCGGRQRGAKRCSCETPQWDRSPAEDMRAYQQWCEQWAVGCLRLLKPGGHLLAFGGSRTFHRLACAVEDAGFEIRDCISWLYGSGFPKSLDVSKAIDRAAGAEREVVASGRWAGRESAADLGVMNDDAWRGGAERVETAPATEDARRWQGWGTALKPAWEPIIVARKPLTGTVAGNVLAHGTGALNIDATRIGEPEDKKHPGTRTNQRYDPGSPSKGIQVVPPYTVGRWPANVVLDEDAAAQLDQQSGVTSSVGKPRPRSGSRGVTQGATQGGTSGGYNLAAGEMADYGDSGGASRFYYTAKAAPDERPRVNGIAHPTVKPLDLIRWLVRLVTPPGGLILDPFAGSGTTGEAALIEGFRAVLIEREADYLPLIQARLNKPIQPVLEVAP